MTVDGWEFNALRLLQEQALERSMRMKGKSERTVEVYKKCGAEMRLLKTLAIRTMIDTGDILGAAGRDRFSRCLDDLSTICCQADENMFRDNPELPDEYIDIFYGTTEIAPRNALEKEILAIARQTAQELVVEEQEDAAD